MTSCEITQPSFAAQGSHDPPARLRDGLGFTPTCDPSGTPLSLSDILHSWKPCSTAARIRHEDGAAPL